MNFLSSQRDKFNHEVATVNQKIYNADQYKQKMENCAADLRTKRETEKKRQDTVRGLQQQVVGLENDLKDLADRGSVYLLLSKDLIN